METLDIKELKEMKISILILLSFISISLYSQEKEKIPFDLTKADTSIYYKYDLDSLNYCLVKFNYKQRISDYIFSFKNEKKSSDTLYFKNKMTKYLSQKGEITIDKNGTIFIGGILKNYSHGKRYFYYGKTKKLSSIREMRNGKKYGLEQQFYDNGQVKMERFNDTINVQHKWRKTYYENGALEQDLEMKENYYLDKVYYDNEQLLYLDTVDYDQGIIGVHKSYYSNGNPKEEKNYKQGVLSGKFKCFYENGTLSMEGNYFTDHKDGLIKVYYENGKLKRSTNYNFGKKDGLEKIYNENGVLTYEIEYKNDKKISKKRNKN